MNVSINGLSVEQLGISTLTWLTQPIAWGIRRAAALGFARVDVGLIASMNGTGPGHLVADPEAVLGPIQTALNETGISAAAFNTRVTPGADQTRIQQEARALCRAATELGLTDGVTLDILSAEAGLKANVDWLRPAVEVCLDSCVVPMVESHRGDFTETVEGALALLDALPGLMFTLDASHYISQGLQPEDWQTLLPFTAHAHIRPCDRHRLQVPIAEMSADTAAWLKQMAAHGYRGTVTTEIIQKDEDGAEDASTSLRDVLFGQVVCRS